MSSTVTHVATHEKLVGLFAMLPALRRGSYATSRWACSWVAVTFLVYALLSAALFLGRYGYPL